MVLGLGFSGVGALHSLGEMRPRPPVVAGVDHNPKEIGYASRVGPMHLAPAPWEEDGRSLREELLSLARRYDRSMVLYPCGDDYVRFLSLHRQALADRFLFLMPDPSTLELLMNKAAFADAARGLGLAAPACAVVEAAPGLRLPEPMRYPIVAKALTSLHSDPFWGVIRVRQFDGAEDWDRFFRDHAQPGSRLMIQEMVVGDDTHQHVYEGLFSAEGREIAAFTAQKIRQQPPGYGSSSRAVCRLDPEVLESSRRLLSAVGYRGLVDVDFKRDARDGGLRIMEVNPRLGGIHRVGRTFGIELVQDAYRLACGQPARSLSQAAGREGHWCHLSKDLRGLLPQLRKRPWLLFPWLATYLSFPRDALFTWRDPGPWAKAMGRLCAAILRELRSGGWREEKI